MDFLYRTKPPTYRSAGPTPQRPCPTPRPGFLEGIWCAVFGGLFKRSSPTYRTIVGTSPSTASDCGSPQYNAPPEGPPSPEPAPGEEQMGEDCSCEPDVEPRGEIHIYPGG
jgi:hypothetical protein